MIPKRPSVNFLTFFHPTMPKTTTDKTAEIAKPAKKAPTAFSRPLTPSADLAAVIGDKPVPRTEVVKLMWGYIKAHNLQDAKNKRNINSDAKLAKVFGKPQVTMFEMSKLIGSHLK